MGIKDGQINMLQNNNPRVLRLGGYCFCNRKYIPHNVLRFVFARHGDPYGNRTHVTAVKGRCLNRLTNGPGSGNLIRTDDIPGMNRLLYQLSYAAVCGQRDFGTAEISFVIISEHSDFVK